jgi:hypothetical protein
MPVAEFREYVDTLEHFASIGVERVELGNLSPAETVRQTIRQDDGVISFRVRSGKGSKPAKVSADEFSEVTGLLRSTLEAVENAATKLA